MSKTREEILEQIEIEKSRAKEGRDLLWLAKRNRRFWESEFANLDAAVGLQDGKAEQ